MIGVNDDYTVDAAPAFPVLVEVTTSTVAGAQPFHVNLVDNRGGRIGLCGADNLADATRFAWEKRASFRIAAPVRHASTRTSHIVPKSGDAN